MRSTLGSVLHQALEWFSQPNPPHELNDEWLSEHYAISLSEAQQVRQWCETIVHQPQWRVWFDRRSTIEAHNEMSLMTADGQIKRMIAGCARVRRSAFGLQKRLGCGGADGV